jgi:hypothetical protein
LHTASIKLCRKKEKQPTKEKNRINFVNCKYCNCRKFVYFVNIASDSMTHHQTAASTLVD